MTSFVSATISVAVALVLTAPPSVAGDCGVTPAPPAVITQSAQSAPADVLVSGDFDTDARGPLTGRGTLATGLRVSRGDDDGGAFLSLGMSGSRSAYWINADVCVDPSGGGRLTDDVTSTRLSVVSANNRT